jgi:pseudouridine-5'-phosphate glycosidase
MTRSDDYLEIAPEVAEALAGGRPVVALESTLIAHGLPAPIAVDTARALEGDVRAGGATPATIAVVDGRLRVGLDRPALERVAAGEAAEPRSAGPRGAGPHDGGVRKLSRRDLASALALGWTGATTVAATMAVARMAGIRVFATGGIGGVHRGAAATMDISADLPELARTAVCVVCAGAKAILDLRLTLEYLETLGVPVLGYQTDCFPAFYCRESAWGVDARVESAMDAARIAHARWTLGLGGGPLVCVPAPADVALPWEETEAAIGRALAAAEQAGIAGKALTPFLLAAVADATGGRSVQANVALVRQNARVAAEIAGALSSLPPCFPVPSSLHLS